MRTSRARLIVAFLVSPAGGLGGDPGGDPGDWPQWRGAHGDGLSHDVAWSENGRTLWTTEIGLGYSQPVVSAGRVFTYGHDAQRSKDMLRALELDSGRELWRQEWAGELRDFQHEGGTLSTPAVAGELVIVGTNLGLVHAFHVADGRPRWTADQREKLGLDPGYYGFAGSPIVDGGEVLISLDRTLALKTETGELLWASEPLEALYTTPVLVHEGERSLVGAFSQQALHFLERASGKELARFPWHKSDRLVNAATPVIVGARVFVSSAYDHGCALVELADGGARSVWESRAMKSKMAGCVLVDGALYGFDESLLECLDLDGQERWRVRGLGNGAVSGGDGKLAVLSSSGELIVARASASAFEELSRVALFDGGVCWTPPTIAGGRILARNNRGTLVCRDHRASATGTNHTATAASVAATAEAPPTADALFERHLAAIGGKEAVAKLGALRLSGTYEQRSVGFVPVPYEIRWAAPDRRRVQVQLPPPLEGHVVRVHDGVAAFELNPRRGDRLFDGAEEREERTGARLFALAEGAAPYAELAVAGPVAYDGRDCWRVDAKTHDGAQRSLYFERASGFFAGREATDEAAVACSDYRAFVGVKLATRERCFRPVDGIEETFHLEAVSVEPVDETLYARPEAIERALAERNAK